jgi:predicted MFS family arabinose efflux permease
MLMFAGFTVIPFISAYVVSNAGMKEADLPYLYFVGGLATFFTARLFGRLVDRYDKRKIFVIVAIISIGPILLITQLSETPLLMILVVTSLFMILVSGRFIPAMALIISSVAPHLRGSFMSFNASVQQIAAGLASLLAGTMIGVSATGKMTNFDMVGVIAAVSTVFCILLAIRLKSVE